MATPEVQLQIATLQNLTFYLIIVRGYPMARNRQGPEMFCTHAIAQDGHISGPLPLGLQAQQQQLRPDSRVREQPDNRAAGFLKLPFLT